MRDLPDGTATFLFSDIEGSTRLLRELDETYDQLLADHRRLLRLAWSENNGVEVGTEGDSFFVAFSSATDAVRAALDAQTSLAEHAWPDGVDVLVRIGLHTGEARVVAGDYVGLAVHHAARISAAAHGGQVVISQETHRSVAGELPADTVVIDLGDHHLKDLPDAQRLFQLNATGSRSDFPPLRSLDVRRHNLPAQVTSFIGRDDDLYEVRDLVASNRLVTLMGAGGCGKTRLAIEVAGEVLADFGDGVRMVDLAAVSDPGLVGQAIAAAMELRDQEGKSVEAALEDYFAGKHMLLVLDNCEHLVGSCADVAERLLKVAPRLSLLVTTREALGIDGEVAWRVPSLEVPDIAEYAPEALRRCAAVRLFVDRAVAIDNTFAPTADGLASIAQICRRLDGIPMAIELAASRIEVLTPPQIAERLDDRFRLLTGGKRTALARQQTLRALVDWSYDLLDDTEKRLLERLSVFTGGATLEAVECVCSGGDVLPDDVLDLLAQLVRKSLVIAEKSSDGVRYRLLETIRQYGREKVIASPDAADLRTGHRDHFLDLVELAEPELRGADQTTWLNELDAEQENIRVALEWSIGDHPVLLRMTGLLWRYWWIRGKWTEGRAWCAHALEGADGSLPALEAKARWAAGFLATFQGAYQEAEPLLDRSLAIAEQTDDPTAGYALWTLGYIAYHRDTDIAVARGRYEDAKAIGERNRDDQLVGWCLLALGSLIRPTDIEEARELFEQALALSRRAGDPWNAGMALNNLGAVSYQVNGSSAARAFFDQAIEIWRGLGDRHGLAKCLTNRATVDLAAGADDAAELTLQEVLEITRDSGDRFGLSNALTKLGSIAMRRRDFDTTNELIAEADAILADLGESETRAALLNMRAWLAHLCSHDDVGVRDARASLGLLEGTRSSHFAAGVLHTLGEAHRGLGEHDEAFTALAQALRGARTNDDMALCAACLAGLAGLAVSAGTFDRAARLFGAAEALRESAKAEPEDKEIYERDVEGLRAAMPATALEVAWDLGRRASLDEIVELALSGD